MSRCERVDKEAPRRGRGAGAQLVGQQFHIARDGGASMTVLELDEELTKLWDAHGCTPALRWGV